MGEVGVNSERIEEIQKQTAYPESQSVFTALHQVWNEVGQEYQAEIRQLEARVARLEQCIIDSNACLTLHHPIQAKANGKALNETPQQGLAKIRAEIGRGSFMRGVYFVESTALQNHDPIPLGTRRRIANEAADKYAEEIRQQADKG